jgi:siroheme synthase
MGVHSLPVIVNSLIEAGRSPDTPIALIQEGTLPEQKVVTGTLAYILDEAEKVKPPAIIIVGEVVNMRSTLEWFRPDLEFSLID